MGQRANYIIVENKKHEIYYSHWDGTITPNIAAQGLAFCEQYFKKFPKNAELLDTAWSEGGILLDKDEKLVMIFGGEDFDYIPALQRHFCTHMQNTWETWTFKWCTQGNIDFANYLNIMNKNVLADACFPNYIIKEEWSDNMEPSRNPDVVVTIINNHTFSDYKMDCGYDTIENCIARGEDLINQIPNQLKFHEWQSEHETSSSLLVDYDNRKLFVCWGRVEDYRHEEEARKIWHGWDVIRQTEGVIFHFKYTGRNLEEIEMSFEEFIMYCERNNSLTLPDRLR